MLAEKFIRGLSVAPPLTLLNNSTYLTIGIDEESLDMFVNSNFADTTFLTLNEKFRISSNLTYSLTINRFDSDGTIITDSWLPVANFTSDMDTNKSGLEINGQDVMVLIEHINADVLAVQARTQHQYGQCVLYIPVWQ